MKKSRTLYKVIVNVNLAYYIRAKDRDEALGIVENFELPKEYVENSFNVVLVAKHETT
jgi:hypothetical protein